MAKTQSHPEVRNRISEVRKMRFSEIQGHDLNYRRHPKQQRQALEGAVAEVGFATVPLAYYSQRNNGALTWLDGHLRSETFPGYEGDVAILDIQDSEADLLLVVLDPMSAMAEIDASMLAKLMETAHAESDALQALIQSLSEGAGIQPPSVLFPEFDEDIADDVKFHTCPSCGHQWPQ